MNRLSRATVLAPEVSSVRVEYLIREARITEIGRFGDLCLEMGQITKGDSPIDTAGLLRQLVYIPNATVLIAVAGREIAGGAILALRPSVRAGGFIGTVDVLVVGRGHDAEKVADLLIAEVVRSARNKGCTQVEVSLTRNTPLKGCWQRHGFTEATAHLYRAGIADRAPATR
jgi:GNAT superfamily N-acetyltransferase